MSGAGKADSAKKTDTPTPDVVRKIITANEAVLKREVAELKEYICTLQTELVLTMQEITRNQATLMDAVANKSKPIRERKVAAAPKAGAAAGAAPAIKIPVSWIQFTAMKFETNDEYYNKMMGEERYSAIADKIPNLAKLKTEAEKRKKQGTGVANWIKTNEPEVKAALMAEHKEFKNECNKPKPPVQQKAEADSDTE